MAAPGKSIDGRTARALRTRDAIVEACIALVDEGDLRPTAPRVAERAGVSVRSVFQHFEDVEGLFAAVGDRVIERLAAFVLLVDPATPLAERLPAVVHQRTTLHEALTPIRRATVIHASESKFVHDRLRAGHAFLRGELERAFAPELDAAGDDRAELLDAVDAVLAWPTWEQLRGLGNCDLDEARAAILRLLRGVFGT